MRNSLRSPSGLYVSIVVIAAVILFVLPSPLSAQTDNDPPVLTGVTIEPGAIDTTTESKTVDVTVSAADDPSGSGLGYAVVQFTTPSGGWGGQAACSFVSGSFEDTCTGTLTVGRFVEPGVWTARVHLAGVVGGLTYTSDDLAGLGFDHQLEVTSVPDTTQPVLTGVTIEPGTVDTTSESQTVEVTVSATDDPSGSGLGYAIVMFATPSGGWGGQVFCSFVSGSFEGTCTGTLTVGRFVEPGWWTARVHLAGVVDAQNYPNVELIGLGFDHQLLVANAGIDVMPGNPDNRLNTSRGGRIAVAVLSSPTFDAPARVNTASLTFGRTGDEPSLISCTPNGVDTNRDRLADLLCFFGADAAGFQVGDTNGVLKGLLTDNSPIAGFDPVRILR